jgi:tetratricopeptide (TPR) repeat protein
VARFYYHKGIFLEKTKRYSEAIEAYDNAFHIYRTMCRSSILFFHHFYEDAFHNNRMPGHQFILESHPRDVIGYDYKGISLDLLSRHSDAIVAFDKAIEISPNFARAYYEKGLVLMKLARYSESIEAFDKALENWSVSIYYFDKFDIDENKAKALEALGRHHEAENIRRTHDVTDQIDESYYESLF